MLVNVIASSFIVVTSWQCKLVIATVGSSPCLTCPSNRFGLTDHSAKIASYIAFVQQSLLLMFLYQKIFIPKVFVGYMQRVFCVLIVFVSTCSNPCVIGFKDTRVG